MRSVLFRVFALVAALGVGVVVVSGGHGCTPKSDPAGVAVSAEPARPGAATSATAASSAPSDDDERGVIGPSTKADPHAIRRAVRGLASGAASASAAPAGR